MKWLRRLFASTPPAAIDWAAIEAPLRCLAHLKESERGWLRARALQFCERKKFHGAAGLQVSDAMRLTIALQACLLTRKLGLGVFDSFDGIVMYPGEFLVPRATLDEAGVVHEFQEPLSGEAWEGGPVVLSWWDVPPEINVTLHEFAHKLDMADSFANGCPRLPQDIDPQHWRDTFTHAFNDFLARVERDEDTALDPYGAESPAEFFAVMTEAFFETPGPLHSSYPGVFELLTQLYAQNPLAEGAD